MFEIQYRRIISCLPCNEDDDPDYRCMTAPTKVGQWNDWHRIGAKKQQFKTVMAAAQSILNSLYEGSDHDGFRMICVEENCVVYEVLLRPLNRRWQFRFPEIVSPWKIGLNDD